MVSDRDIQREIDNLRSFRRRSASSGGPGAIPLDPDLPPASPPSSPPNQQNGHWLGQQQSPSSSNYDPPLSPTRTSSPASVFNRTRSGSIERLGGQLQNTSLTNDNDDRVLGQGDVQLGGILPPEPSDDQSQLFWVPARLHPELAPGEFRAFLKNHSHTDSDGVVDGVGEATGALAGPAAVHPGGSGPGLARSPSWLSRSGQGNSGGLGRKRSMLSKQYQPKFNDGVETEPPPLPSEASKLRRSGSNRSSIYGGVKGDQGVTLEELQRLETLVDEAGVENDPAQMRSLLRRNLSMQASPGYVDDQLAPGDQDDEDAPIIAGRPGQILRRSARTRIRKPNLPGDGGGHRFPASRKVRSASGNSGTSAESEEYSHPDDVSESQQRAYEEEDRRRQSDDSDDMYSAESGNVQEDPDRLAYRRPSTGSTDESAIYDSYVGSSTDTSLESSATSFEDSSESGIPTHKEHHGYANDPYAEEDQQQWQEPQRTPTESTYRDPGRAAIVGYGADQYQSGSPSPPETIRQRDSGHNREPVQTEVHHNQMYSHPSAQNASSDRISNYSVETPKAKPEPSTPKRIERQQSTESLKTRTKEEKEKKRGGFFSSKKDKEKPKKEGKKEKEGFLGSLFGSKKKAEEPAPLKFSSAGPAAAAALLGSSKSAKSLGLIPMSGNSPTSPGFSPYARYPIHVERAIYRLSHIKLANPRRPLYEQVLISNLMFWYLGIINKPQTPSPTVSEEKNKPAEKADGPEALTERAASPSHMMDSVPSPKAARSASPASSGRSSSPPVQSSPTSEPVPAKRTGLSKPETQSRTRAAETPVRTPQYGIQNMQVQQEYRRPASPAQQPVRAPQPQAPSPQAMPAQRRPVQAGPPSGAREDAQRSVMPRPPRSPDNLRTGPAQSQNALPPPAHREPPPRLRVEPEFQRPVTQHRGSQDGRPVSEGPYPPHRQEVPLPRERKQSDVDRPRSPHSPTSGIQPGQIFHHPSMNVQPGQVFSAQRTSPGQPVGQVFSHPSYQNPVQHSAPQGLPAGYYTERQSHNDLPPGAMPPRHVQQNQQWRQAPPPQPLAQPRPPAGYDYEQAKRSASAVYQTPQQPREVINGPRSFSAGDPRSYNPQQYPAPSSPGRSHPPARDEQPYNPYLRQPVQHANNHAGERR